MASRISVSTLVTMRDNLIVAFNKLAIEGVSSYSIGDTSFTMRDTDTILEQIEKLDRLIAARDRTLAGKGRNRMSFAKFNG